MKTKIEIKNRWNGSVLFEFECETILDCLKEAIRTDADLSDADLSDADLSDADLSDADLSGANLRSADLSDADLSDADLSDANLSDADLSDANLSGANLRSADLRSANLSGANLRSAKINEHTFGVTINCPEEGSFIGFKKCQGKIVKLLICEDALRSSATSYKCRCSKAKVLEISDGSTEIASDKDSNFIYRVGETVEVTNFDPDRWNECSTGIHFFMNRLMAENY